MAHLITQFQFRYNGHNGLEYIRQQRSVVGHFQYAFDDIQPSTLHGDSEGLFILLIVDTALKHSFDDLFKAGVVGGIGIGLELDITVDALGCTLSSTPLSS